MSLMENMLITIPDLRTVDLENQVDPGVPYMHLPVVQVPMDSPSC